VICFCFSLLSKADKEKAFDHPVNLAAMSSGFDPNFRHQLDHLFLRCPGTLLSNLHLFAISTLSLTGDP
jgi:hypothetical protein